MNAKHPFWRGGGVSLVWVDSERSGTVRVALVPVVLCGGGVSPVVSLGGRVLLVSDVVCPVGELFFSPPPQAQHSTLALKSDSSKSSHSSGLAS